MSFKVLKSGGVSTGSSVGYQRLREEVRRQVGDGHQVVVVVSAPAQEGDRTENRVTELLRTTANGTDRRERIAQLFSDIASPLRMSFERKNLDQALDAAQTPDEYVFLGEHLQAQQFARYIGAEWIDARDILITSDTLGSGKVLRVNTSPFETKKPVYVIGGFYGRSIEGRTVILPSGGSDLTADVIAASLHAEEYINLKEEPGIRAADPRIVENAEVIPKLTYRELRELSYGGSAVLQEEAMSWSRKAGIPITVRSLLPPYHSGTKVVQERNILEQGIVGIATKKGFVLYTLKREHDPQFFQDLFDAFTGRGMSLDMIGTENGLVSIAFEQKELEKSSASDIESFLNEKYNLRARYETQALVSVVGEGITGPLTLEDRIIQVLDGQVNARYGPILGGPVPSTTIYHIERFGMNSEYGVAQAVMECFAYAHAPITGISTTIDSISIGTSAHGNREEIREMSRYLLEKIQPDTLSATRNGLQYYGPHRVPSNITVAVNERNCERVVQKLYAEFF